MRPIVLIPTVALAATLLVQGCAPDGAGRTAWAEEALATAEAQLDSLAARFADSTRLPRSWNDGLYRTTDIYDWTSGFLPGSLWLIYELRGEESLAAMARSYTARLDTVQYYTGNHDIGFMLMCSYGNQLRLTGEKACVKTLVNGAESLVKRYDPAVGLIRSWDFGKWNYPVIIDNMMNLELLFKASELSGDPRFAQIATTHADNTMKNHFRPNNSSYHVVSYNDDGTVESRGTFQGLADSSAWARGQAWGLYGYTMCFRCTGEERYLEQARRIASFILDNPALPEDMVPYWDYNAPNIPDAPRDASAAAITASALVELSTLTSGEEAAGYMAAAGKILRSLSTPAYLAARGENGYFIFKHSVGHLPANSEIDVPLNYADYYYLEAFKRYMEVERTK